MQTLFKTLTDVQYVSSTDNKNISVFGTLTATAKVGVVNVSGTQAFTDSTKLTADQASVVTVSFSIGADTVTATLKKVQSKDITELIEFANGKFPLTIKHEVVLDAVLKDTLKITNIKLIVTSAIEVKLEFSLGSGDNVLTLTVPTVVPLTVLKFHDKFVNE